MPEASTTIRLTPLAPTNGSQRSTGVSIVANETRPQVRPLIGQAPRRVSTATHTIADHNGQARDREPEQQSEHEGKPEDQPQDRAVRRRPVSHAPQQGGETEREEDDRADRFEGEP